MSVQKKTSTPMGRTPRRSLSRTRSLGEQGVRPQNTSGPTLRLVGTDSAAAPVPTPAATPTTPQRLDASDPRWVLARRAAESLQGTVLTPDRRRGLMRLASVMGLTAFDASLVLAIVQDQARRGYPPEHCAAAGADQLLMIPAPAAHAGAKARRLYTIAGLTLCLIALQAITVWWLLTAQ